MLFRCIRIAVVFAAVAVLWYGECSAQQWVQKVPGGGLGNPLAVNPLNSNILYGAVRTDSVFVSRDRGYSWEVLGSPIPGGGMIKSIAISPNDTSRILCGVKVGVRDRIVRSTDDGATWTQTWSGVFSFYGKPVECKSIHPDTCYTMGSDSLWRSTDFGSTWSLVRVVSGFDAWCDAELDPFNASIMMVGDYTTGIWKTTDAGADWYKVMATSGTAEIPSIAYDPFNQNTLYAGHYGDGGGLLKSTDGGESWFCLSTPIKPDCNSTNGGNSWWVTCSTTEHGYVYFGTYGSLPQGIFLSRDAGTSWAMIDSGLNVSGFINYGLLALDTLTVITLQSDGLYRLEYPAGVHVTSPNGGEVWKAGSTHSVTWADSGLFLVKIDYSTNDGASWSIVADSVAATAGSYPWTLPLILSNQYRVRVSDRLFTQAADTSDSVFTVFRTPPVLTNPHGGESWEAGTVHNITWNAVPQITSVNIFSSSDGGTLWNYVTTQSVPPDTLHWVVPNFQSPNCKVIIQDAEDSFSSDTSTGFFTIFEQQDFFTTIHARDQGTGSDSITFGNQPGATDGIDTSFGESVLGPIPPEGTFDVRWLEDSNNGMKTDVRDTLGNGVGGHLFHGFVQPGAGGYPVSMTWDSSGMHTNTFIMRDTATHGSRLSVDMRQRGRAEIADSGSGTFEIMECPSVSVVVTHSTGWNLICVPVIVGDRSAGGLFPQKDGRAFEYRGYYLPLDTLLYGRGYWVKASSGITLTGCALTTDTIPIRTGWNMIGGLSVPVSIGSAQQNPPNVLFPNMFGYNGTGYFISGTLEPGYGYWVKARSDGMMVLNAGAGQVPKSGRSPLENMHTMTVSDGLGHSQVLYFGVEPDSLDGGDFEMPPRGPENAFDARFGNQRILAAFDPAKLANSIEFPILLKSSSKKIFFSWGVDNDKNFSYILSKRFGNQQVTEFPLRGTGSVAVAYDEQSSVSLRIQLSHGSTDRPGTFSLGEAYPNPCNPETRFSYTVPSESRIQIQIYSMLGSKVTTLVDARRSAGTYTARWSGLSVSTGVYVVRLLAIPDATPAVPHPSAVTLTQKVLLLK